MLQQQPSHPRWADVQIDATLQGWVGLQAAQDWLDQHRNGALAPDFWQFQQFLRERQPSGTSTSAAGQNDEALYRTFLQWQRQREPQRTLPR